MGLGSPFLLFCYISHFLFYECDISHDEEINTDGVSVKSLVKNQGLIIINANDYIQYFSKRLVKNQVSIIVNAIDFIQYFSNSLRKFFTKFSLHC